MSQFIQKNRKEVIPVNMSNLDKVKRKIGGYTPAALEMMGCDEKKILKATQECVAAMGKLTIAESKVARKHLDYVMENMYKRSPDTLIETIQQNL